MVPLGQRAAWAAESHNAGFSLRFSSEEGLRNLEDLDAFALDDPSPKRLNHLAIHQNKHVKPPRPNVAVVAARLTTTSPQNVLYQCLGTRKVVASKARKTSWATATATALCSACP